VIRRAWPLVRIGLIATGCATAIQGPPLGTLADGRTGTIAFRTTTVSPRQALLGEGGASAVITRDPDDCFGRGVTVGYDPRAYADARVTVKAFLTTIARGR
jgi:hypothetical protein